MNRLILSFIFSVFFSNLTFGQFLNALENSGTGYTSGIGGINVVGTANTVQTATFSNPSLMFDKKIAAHLSYLNSNRVNGIENQFLNTAAHYSTEKYAFGVFHKRTDVETHSLFVDVSNVDPVSGRGIVYLGRVDLNSSLTGISGAYKLANHWRVGVNINYYVNSFIPSPFDSVPSSKDGYATIGLGTQYQNNKELANGNEINWSFGAAINNFGAKQNNYFIKTEGKIGGTFGYLININKNSNLHFTLLYQADKYLVARDREQNAFVGMFTSLFDEEIEYELPLIFHRFGLEMIYTNSSSFKIGFRTTLEQNSNLWADELNSWNLALVFGYKNFYLNLGYHQWTDTFSYYPQRSIGAEFGYQLDF